MEIWLKNWSWNNIRKKHTANLWQCAFFDPNRKETEKFSTIEEQKSDLILRSNKEKERYKKVYGIDKSDMSNYDFIVDSTNLTPEELKNLIISEYKKWLQN